MRKLSTRILTFLLLLVLSEGVKAQCTFNLSLSATSVPCGRTVTMTALAYSSVPSLSTNFDNGTAGPGWQNAGVAAFGQPCGVGPNNTPYYWASTAANANPSMTTNGFDVSCGGSISFDMAYAVQGGAAPCEGPDEQDEGVSLQYSTNGGATWITIVYYSPGGFTLAANPFVGGGILPPGNITAYTSWSNFVVNIPPGAFSASTMFRWIQESPTSGTCCDNWGIDNVVITPLVCGPGANYWWSNNPGVNSSTQTITITSDTTITVYYDDGVNFCDSTFTINVIQPTATNLAGGDVYCAGEPVSDIMVNVTGISGWTVDYTLNGSPMTATGTTSPINLGNAPGIYVLSGVTDSSCYNVANGTQTITINPLPNAGVDAVVAYCADGAAEDLFPLLGPTADPGGNWFLPNGAPTTMPHDPVTMPAGQYMYVADALACSDTAYVDVTHIVTDITAIVPTPVTCNGLSDGFIDMTGVNYMEYSVDGAPAVAATSPTNVGGFSAGNYSITVTSAEGCTDTETFTISEPAALTLASAVTDASCFSFCDGQVNITPNGGVAPYVYTWSGITGDQSGNGSGMCAGTYTISVNDIFGCSEDITFNVGEPENVIPLLIVDTAAGCFPHQVDFENVTASSIIETTYIDFGDGSVETFVGLAPFEHTYQKPGVYDVYILVTTTDGCVFEYTFEDLIEAYNNPIANFYVNPNNVSMLEPHVNLVDASSDGIVFYEWFMEGATPLTSNSQNVNHVQYPFDAPGSYPVWLTITDVNGCQDSILKYVSILNDLTFFAPNAFTPDGDEHNQTWEFHINGIDVGDFHLRIFDRWGELIWESFDSQVYWDGTYKGKIVKEGMYIYTVECGDIFNDRRYTFNGHVSVLR